MKSLLRLTIAMLVTLFVSNAFASENEFGTLTLKADKIVFQVKSKTFIYPVGKIGDSIPDAKLIKFEPKVISKDGKETDISELTLENISDGKHLILIESIPVKATHVISGSQRGWKLE